jgi:hypothetical protein
VLSKFAIYLLYGLHELLLLYVLVLVLYTDLKVLKVLKEELLLKGGLLVHKEVEEEVEELDLVN